ncbi:hypothetical protein DWZ57_01525, partial [Bacteroides fragilis]
NTPSIQNLCNRKIQRIDMTFTYRNQRIDMTFTYRNLHYIE